MFVWANEVMSEGETNHLALMSTDWKIGILAGFHWYQGHETTSVSVETTKNLTLVSCRTAASATHNYAIYARYRQKMYHT